MDTGDALIPHLIVDNCAEAITFYKKAFGAVEITRAAEPDGHRIVHAEIRIDGKAVFLCDDFPERWGGKRRTPSALGGTPVTIHRFVEDCDAAIHLAQLAGAEVTMPPRDMFWGDRYASVKDPFGHSWTFATHVRDLSPEELAEAARQAILMRN
ncbi:MAG: VOC family protein [Candidatus Hydrogenedentales bacterium]